MHTPPPLQKSLKQQLSQLYGSQRLLTQPEECLAYGYDNSKLQAMPQAVVFPLTHAEVLATVNACLPSQTPIVARGRGSGTPGGCVPIAHGVVMSFERMDKILDFSAADRSITVEPGVLNQTVQNHAATAGLMWGPDPSSSAFCSVGGNLAYGAAGPHAIKYGTTRENTLAITAVTGEGKTLHAGVKTSKGVMGYDLTRLLVGSEGTLGLITQATLKLVPKAEHILTFGCFCDCLQKATDTVAQLLNQTHQPCALEMMDGACLELIRDIAPLAIPANAQAMIIGEIETLADNQQAVEQYISKKISPTTIELYFPKDDTQKQKLWTTRKSLSPQLRKIAPKKINEDVVVPVSQLGKLIQDIQKLSQQFKLPIVCFGHAGNGNIHVNLMVDHQNPEQLAQAEPCLNAVFDTVLKLGGTLSGEHGVGLVKMPYMTKEFDSVSLELMQKIKQVFDPSGILNPGKIFPKPSTC